MGKFRKGGFLPLIYWKNFPIPTFSHVTCKQNTRTYKHVQYMLILHIYIMRPRKCSTEKDFKREVSAGTVMWRAYRSDSRRLLKIYVYESFLFTLYRIFGCTLCSQCSVTLEPFSTYFLTTKCASTSDCPSKNRRKKIAFRTNNDVGVLHVATL